MYNFQVSTVPADGLAPIGAGSRINTVQVRQVLVSWGLFY